MCDSNLNKTDEVDKNDEKIILNAEPEVITDENLNQVNSVIKPTKQKTWVKCDLCNVPLSSKNSVNRHIIGKRHIANVKKLTGANNQNNKKLHCEICKIKTNGTKQLEDHLKSNKHNIKVEMIERRKQLKNNCFLSLLIGFFIFAIVINIFYIMFTYTQPM